MSVTPTPAVSALFPLADADQCVKCGLCLPHCPTYLQTGNEADSPRGRIALMQGLATGLVPLTAQLEAHLDGCLSCRACEPVCPAKVPYGRLIDAGRGLMLQHKPGRARLGKRPGYWLTHPWARRSLGILLWLYQRLGVQWLVRHSGMLGKGRLARLESLLPRVSLPLPLPAANDRQAQAALFTGCAGELADRQTLKDALRVLTRLGIATSVPGDQGCCGALHQHNGDADGAAQLARKNLQVFSGETEILCSASGCGATLMEYPELIGTDGADFSSRVRDLCAYLLENWPQTLALKPLTARVAIHTPCTQKNVVRQAQAARALLEKIPGLELVELDITGRCCGAAGSYFISQPEMADALLTPKLDSARKLAPDYIVSSNIGCSMHIAAGLRRAGLKVELLHPVSLLARQLGQPASRPALEVPAPKARPTDWQRD